ncbi:MAG: hypothetical protein ABS35_19615 [Kaistia sp. SCN 65-12]|nr:MAG: hypothetical protein ABS35_19615 [Kaistia sp. SCN 65-12]
MAERRRLNSLDLVPDHARDDIVWAMGEMNQRQRTQADILFELNDRLGTKGVDPISASAFSRASVRLRKRAMQLDERRTMYAGLAEKLTPEEIGQHDIILAEFLKTLIDELLDAPDITPKQALELSRAHRETVMAQRASADHRWRTQDAEREKLVKAAEDAIGAVEKSGRAVDGSEILRLIRESYGMT